MWLYSGSILLYRKKTIHEAIEITKHPEHQPSNTETNWVSSLARLTSWVSIFTSLSSSCGNNLSLAYFTSFTTLSVKFFVLIHFMYILVVFELKRSIINSSSYNIVLNYRQKSKTTHAYDNSHCCYILDIKWLIRFESNLSFLLKKQVSSLLPFSWTKLTTSRILSERI